MRCLVGRKWWKVHGRKRMCLKCVLGEREPNIL